MVAWGAIGSAVAAGAKTIGAGIGKIGSFLGKNAGNILKFGAGASSLLGGFNFGNSGGTDLNDSMALMRYQTDLQKEYSQWLNENSYTHMRTGLENAGYNPLLAVGATPQSGSVGLGSAVSGNTATYDGQKAVEAIDTLTNTAKTRAGVLGQILGTDIFNTAKGFLNNSGISKGLERLIKKTLNTANGALDAVDKATDEVDKKYKNFTLKGYVSNSADSNFDYAPEYDALGKLPPELSKYK